MRAALVLFLAVVVCYGGARIAELGFYLDDWPLLAKMVFEDPGWLDELKTSHGYRPFSSLTWLIPFKLFGLNAALWQSLMALLQWALAGAVYAALRTLKAPASCALLGALVFLAFPNKDSTLYWPDVSLILSSSLLCWLGAWLAHERGRGVLAALLLAAALCFYDQCFFLLPVFLLTGTRRGFLLCAAAVLAFAAFKFGLMPRLVPYNKTFSFSPSQPFTVYLMALRSTFDPRWLWYLARTAAHAAAQAPLLALGAVLLPLAVARQSTGAPGSGRLALWGLAVWVLGYLPLCVSTYAPSAYDEMNRLNQLPAVGAAALLTAAAWHWRRPGALAALASFFLLVHVGFGEIWRDAYRRQLHVRDKVLSNLDRWPKDKHLLVRLPENYAARKAPVFITSYDISAAIQIWTGDRERRAWTYNAWTKLTPEGLSAHGTQIPLSRVLLLDVETGQFGPPRPPLPPYLHPWEKPVAFRSRS